MVKVITVTLRKGGSGKTTTAINLASGLAKHGKKVLLIDLDAQANATIALKVDDKPNIVDVLTGKQTLRDVIKPCKDFYIVPSYPTLAQVEAGMTADHANIINQILQPIKDTYDFIIIDTPPSESLLTVASLIASDDVLIPTQAHYLAVHGLQQAMTLIDRVRTGYNTDINLLGILPTMVQTGTNMAELFIQQLNTTYGDKVLPYPIPHTIKITESQLLGETLLDYDINHPASLAYMELSKHVINERHKK